MYINDRDEINYHGFLRSTRKMQKATSKSAAEGLCSYSAMTRYEKGERVPEKLMRDRISSRLGVSSEEYEDYLNPTEYRQWQIRQYVLSKLDKGEFEEVERGLEELNRYEDKNKVQKQFMVTVRYMMLQKRGASKEELRPLIEEAIGLTEIDMEKALKGTQLLSEQELNLFLEYISFRNPTQWERERGYVRNRYVLSFEEWSLEECEKILTYVEKSFMDDIAKAKIYPRVACTMAKLVIENEIPEELTKRALEVCELAIESLRKASRIYYFIELVEYHIVLLEKIKPYRYKKLMARDKEWIELFKELFAEYEVEAYMPSFSYFYWESECHSIVEVLEVRRNMYGLSRIKLSDELCTDKTIIRYERYDYSPILPIVRDLFERMGMCAEYKRARVVTSNPEALRLSNALAVDVNNHNTVNSMEKIEELKECLDMEIIFNQQEIYGLETALKLEEENPDTDELYDCAVKALECTIPFEYIERKGKRYLTRSELQCMYNLAFDTEGEKADFCRSFIEKLCMKSLDRDMRAGRVCLYELLMGGVERFLGNVGRYEESTALNNKMIKESLKNRRFYNIVYYIYENLWNVRQEAKEKGELYDVAHARIMLQKCVAFSELNNRTYLATFFQDKLADLDVV